MELDRLWALLQSESSRQDSLRSLGHLKTAVVTLDLNGNCNGT